MSPRSGTTGAERNRRRKEAELDERIKNSTPLQPKDARWGQKVYIIPGRGATPLIGFTERPRMQRGVVMEYIAKLGACVAWYSKHGIVEAAWFKLSELVLIEDVELPNDDTVPQRSYRA